MLTNLSHCAVLLDSVDELREGQATAEFEIHRQPDKTHLSFSLIYNMRKAFNLIAENEEQYKTWVNTLKCLIKKQVDEESAYVGPESLHQGTDFNSPHHYGIPITDMRSGRGTPWAVSLSCRWRRY